MIHIGDFIRSFQRANGIKSVDIATKLGMSRGSYSALLSRANPTVQFDDRYAIVAYIDSFGVCEESEVAKCENVVEVCYSTKLSDQERERINMVKALESIKFFQGKKEDYY